MFDTWWEWKIGLKIINQEVKINFIDDRILITKGVGEILIRRKNDSQIFITYVLSILKNILVS